VADILKDRGITVTTAVKSKGADKSDQGTKGSMDQIPEALKNNSSICITPASKAASSQKPQETPTAPAASSPQTNSGSERPPRPPTVDLTSENRAHSEKVNGGAQLARLPMQPCHICNKNFSTYAALNTHIGMMHAGNAADKIPFRYVVINPLAACFYKN